MVENEGPTSKGVVPARWGHLSLTHKWVSTRRLSIKVGQRYVIRDGPGSVLNRDRGALFTTVQVDTNLDSDVFIGLIAVGASP